jgi:plasmid stabilization system protein ParE
MNFQHLSLEERIKLRVYYRMNESEIVVMAVMHGRRNPGGWKTRV